MSGRLLEVGREKDGSYVIVSRIPLLCEWLGFTPSEARALAKLLLKHADEADKAARSRATRMVKIAAGGRS